MKTEKRGVFGVVRYVGDHQVSSKLVCSLEKHMNHHIAWIFGVFFIPFSICFIILYISNIIMWCIEIELLTSQMMVIYSIGTGIIAFIIDPLWK